MGVLVRPEVNILLNRGRGRWPGGLVWVVGSWLLVRRT